MIWRILGMKNRVKKDDTYVSFLNISDFTETKFKCLDIHFNGHKENDWTTLISYREDIIKYRIEKYDEYYTILQVWTDWDGVIKWVNAY